VHFDYQSLPAAGTCRLAGDVLRLTLQLTHFTALVPDVLSVEAWLKEMVKEPLIVEELAIAAAVRWQCPATVVGRTDTHGTLTAKALP
jgi:hypothetical protein